MLLRFWGVRGSIPTPLTSASIRAKIAAAIKHMPPDLDPRDSTAVQSYVESLPPLLAGTAGGNTACVEVRSGETLIVIDAGSGLRELGNELMRGPCGRGQGTIHFLLSHLHWDHIQGFPFFTPAYIPGNRLIFYGVHDLATAFADQQRFLNFPIALDYMRATKEFKPISEGQPFQIDHLQIATLRNPHPGASYSFRINDYHSTFVYASDAEYKNLSPVALQPRIEFFRNADAIVFDAQYTLKEAWQKVDWGHSSAMIGVDMAHDANVRRLILFHHDPTYADSQLEAMRQTAVAFKQQKPGPAPQEIIVAYEGLTIDLTPAGRLDLRRLPEGDAVLTATRIFDTHSITEIAERLSDNATSDTMIDLSQVETLTTADLKALVAIIRAHRNKQLVLISPSPAVQEVIRLGGYADFFAVYPSVAAAQEADQLRAALNLPGHLLAGRYRIESHAGTNPLGPTLRATDMATGKIVAIRVLWTGFSEATIERMRKLMLQFTRVDDPCIRRVFSVETDSGITFIVGEWIDTITTLAMRNAPQPPEPTEALRLATFLARSLQLLHSHGIVHGDLQPTNVFLTERGPLLSYTAVGRLAEGRALLDAPLLLLNSAYLSPEQILGQPLDAHSDLYSLGVLFYELFTGQRPFNGDEASVLRAHLEQVPVTPRSLNSAISPSLDHLIMKLLSRHPNERYASAQQVAQVLENLAAGVAEEGVTGKELAGRDTERAALLRAWDTARNGHGRLVFITGEPGSGKSSLAHQVMLESNAPVVLLGTCREQPIAAAYQPFAEALHTYFASAPPELHHEALRADLAILARLVPSLHLLIPDLPPLTALDPIQEQLRLMSSLARVIQHATAERPWLLILDDLHWADSGSLMLLRALGRRLPHCALLVIGTYRDADLGREHPLREALHDLSRYPTYEQIGLDRLDHAAVGQMLNQIWQRHVPETVVMQIYRHTEGNPFYVESLARALIEEGQLTHDEEAPIAIESILQLLAGVQSAVLRRINRLSNDTQRLLDHAAVLGENFTLQMLREMSGLDEAELLDHLDTALEHRIVRERAQADEMSFSNAQIRASIYGRLTDLRRRRLHSQAARMIKRLAVGMEQQVAAELAHHYDEAHQTVEALHYGLLAAQQAASDYAHDRALRWYRRVLSLATALDVTQKARRAAAAQTAFEGMGNVLKLAGRQAEAQMAYEQALIFAEEQQDYAGMARVQLALGALLHTRGELQTATRWLDLALENYTRLHDESGRGRALGLQAAILRDEGDLDAALECFHQSLAILRATGDTAGEAETLQALGILHIIRDEATCARDLLLEALALRRALGERHGIVQTLGSLALIAEQKDADLAQSRKFKEEILVIARETGDLRSLAMATSSLGWSLRLEGKYAEAERMIAESLSLQADLHDYPQAAGLLEQLAGLAALQGRHEYALRLASAANRLRTESNAPALPAERAQLNRDLAESYAALGPQVAATAENDGQELSLDMAVAAVAYALEINHVSADNEVLALQD